ncbi:hypothetical protein [Escherichia coli]|uniref:hypothetical protein n=1 Tax=Escherichia coli TaxID=562 RepID=UPI001ABC0838|nr:hypothetical protein [Escherichia coli]
MGSCAAPSAKGDDKFITTDYLQQCHLFQITDEEQRQLKTIISKNEALERRRARDRKRDEERRRAAGAVERDVYEANSLTKQKPWEVLGMSRAKWYRLGKPSGSETTPSPITNGVAP